MRRSRNYKENVETVDSFKEIGKIVDISIKLSNQGEKKKSFFFV